MIAVVNEIATAWWGWMGPMLWQVSLLILLISAIDLLVGKWAWPQVRYALWLLVLVKLLIPPSWALPTSLIAPTLPWAREQIVRLWAPESAASEQQALAEQASVASAAAAQTAAGRPSTRGGEGAPGSASGPPGLVWQALAMGVWLLGMGLFIALIATRIAKLRRWHREHGERQTIPVWFHQLLVRTARRLGLGRLPAVVFSDQAVAPAVYGVFRPVLLLPAHYTDSLSREEAEHVLLHELAHLKRGDLWLHGLCLLLQVVYWFNPLLLLVRQQMRHVREICCDLTVANLLKGKTEMYRKTLLNTARELLTKSPELGIGLLGVFEEPFRLVARLRWLERETWHRRTWMRATALVVALIVVPLVLPMATVGEELGEEPAAATPAGGSVEASRGAGDGDVCIRTKGRFDSYFLFFQTESRSGGGELWVGGERAALIQDHRWLILDRRNNTLTFANPRARTYVEAPLPLDISTLYSAEVRRARRFRSGHARVTGLGETRTILGRECDGYEIEYWVGSGSEASNPTTMKVWATTELPLDYTLVDDLFDAIRQFDGDNEAAREELREIRGVQMRIEGGRKDSLFSHHFVQEALEIAWEDPPDDVYAVPADYTRKEHLTASDFQ